MGREDPLEEERATHYRILCWDNPMDGGAWRAIVWGPKESDMTEHMQRTE